MLRRDPLAIAAFGAAALVLLAVGYGYHRDASASRGGPRSLQEAGRIAKALGLYHRSDIQSGVVTDRLIISDTPVSFERANHCVFREADHPDWKGIVAACRRYQSYLHYSDPDYGVVWGEIFLYGDPVIIRRLVEAPLPVEAAS